MAGSGAGTSGVAALQRPVAPDLVGNATNVAVAAAAAAIDLSSMEIDVVAVGMGLRFVEIQTNEMVWRAWANVHFDAFACKNSAK